MIDNGIKDNKAKATTETVKEASADYFAMLNKSVAIFNKHRANVEKEIKNGGRLTTHRITL